MPKQENNKIIRRRLANAYLSSVISISLVLLLIGVAALVLINSGQVSRYLKENMKISVVMNSLSTEEDALEYIESISTLPYISSTRMISKEEGQKELEEILGEDFLSVFENSPIPVSVDVTLKAEYVVPDSLVFVREMLSRSEMVDEVESHDSLVAVLNDNLAKLSIVFAVFIALLLFISFVLINNMVRISVYARRFTVHTMKQVGATLGFIRAPFLRSALVQGLVSGIIACGVLFLLFSAARNSFEELFAIFETSTVLYSMGIVLIGGVLICVASTYFVVGKLVGATKDELYY